MVEQEEQWLPVQDFESTHEVSSLGRVRICRSNRLHPAGYVLKGTDNHGQVMMTLSVGGVNHRISLGSILLRSFGPRPYFYSSAGDSNLTGEIWKPVVGLESLYAVSCRGRVRNIGHIRRSHLGKILTPTIRRHGYYEVCLRDRTKNRYQRVHRLVAEAFLEPAESGQDEVNHLNGVKTDNRSENLEWATGSQNQRHASDVLGHYRGEKNAAAKLTAVDVECIRHLYESGEQTRADLSVRFGVSQMQISRIVFKKNWNY